MTDKKNRSVDEEQTDQQQSETASIKKRVPLKKTPTKKKVVLKKATPKKSTSKKKASPKRSVKKKSVDGLNTPHPEIDKLKDELRLMAQQNQQRAEVHEARLENLIHGLDMTFGHIHKSSNDQTKKLGGLMNGLEKVFNSIQEDTQSRDSSNSSSLDQLSQTIIRSSEELRKEYEEMEQLQEKKLLVEKEQHQHSFNILKIIAVPAIILAVLGIGYMFYTVTVMERAMTAMSSDMHAMRNSMGDMTTSVGGMNGNIETMSADMGAMRTSTGEMATSVGKMDNSIQTMSTNMQGMRRDLNVLTHNVAPAMDGLRQVMPWSP